MHRIGLLLLLSLSLALNAYAMPLPQDEGLLYEDENLRLVYPMGWIATPDPEDGSVTLQNQVFEAGEGYSDLVPPPGVVRIQINTPNRNPTNDFPFQISRDNAGYFIGYIQGLFDGVVTLIGSLNSQNIDRTFSLPEAVSYGPYEGLAVQSADVSDRQVMLLFDANDEPLLVTVFAAAEEREQWAEPLAFILSNATILPANE